MNRYVVMVLVAGLLLGAAPAPKEDEAKKDAEQLQGKWVFASLDVDGKVDAPEDKKGVTLVIEKDEFTLRDGDDVIIKGKFKLDPAHKPKAIDIQVTEGNRKGKAMLGIYHLDKDSLKWSAAEPGDKNRPAEFTTKAGAKYVTFTFKKKK